MPNLDGSSNGKPRRWRALLLSALPCVLAVILTGVYALGLWAGFNLTAMNVLCLFLYFVQAAFGCVESINRKKAVLFLGTLFISLAATRLNLQAEGQLLNDVFLSSLSGWSAAWAVLLLISAGSVIIVAIRLLRWSQEQWEEVQKLRQENRYQSKKFWIEYFLSRNAHRMTMQKLLHETREQMERDRCSGKKEEKNIKQKDRIDRLRLKYEYTKDKNNTANHKNGRNRTPKGAFFRTLLALFLCIAAIISFVFIPRIHGLTDILLNWASQVETFSKAVAGNENIESKRQALFFYFFIFILIIVAVASIFNVAYYTIKRRLNGETDKKFNFLDVYNTPISVLLVSVAFLFAFAGGGGVGLSNVTMGWEFLLIAILFILVMLVAVEIVRLILKQCVMPHSLLKSVIYLIFVVILKFLSELLLSVITNFRIQMIVSSVLFLVFPGAETCFEKSVNDKLCKLFCHAILHNSEEEENPSASRVFHRKQIWRRNQP